MLYRSRAGLPSEAADRIQAVNVAARRLVVRCHSISLATQDWQQPENAWEHEDPIFGIAEGVVDAMNRVLEAFHELLEGKPVCVLGGMYPTYHAGLYRLATEYLLFGKFNRHGCRYLSERQLDQLIDHRGELQGIMLHLRHERSGILSQLQEQASSAPPKMRLPDALHDIDPTDEVILKYLRENPSLRILTGAIAAALGRDPRAIGKNLSKLCKLGLITNIRRKGYQIA